MATRSRSSPPGRRHKSSSRTTRRPSAGRTGLSAKTFTGLNEKRMKQKSSGAGKRLIYKQGETRTIQLLQTPRDMKEFDQHSWKEGGQYYFVPCTDDENCEPCQSEDPNISKKNYRFLCNVWSFADKAVKIWDGPKTLATQVFYKYKRKPGVFLKRVYDTTKYPTDPVTHNFELAEQQPVRTSGMKLYDLEEYLQGELERYYEGGSERKKNRGRTALDDEDFEDEDDFDEEDEDDEDFDDEDYDEEDDEEEDDEPSEEEMMDRDAWSWSELKEYAEEVGVRKTTKNRAELVRWIIRRRER